VPAIWHSLAVFSTKMRQSEVFCININFIAYTQRCSGISFSRRPLRFLGDRECWWKCVPAANDFCIHYLASDDVVRWWPLFRQFWGNPGGNKLGKSGKWRWQLSGVVFSWLLTAPGTMTNYGLKVEWTLARQCPLFSLLIWLFVEQNLGI